MARLSAIPLWVRPPVVVTVDAAAGAPIPLSGAAMHLAPGSLGPRHGSPSGRPSRGGSPQSNPPSTNTDSTQQDNAGARPPREHPAPAPQPTYWQLKRAAAVELTKPGITKMVTLTSAVGFLLAIFGSTASWLAICTSAAGCLVGTAFSASGANALNQWWERHRDGLMDRTAGRPIPSSRLHPVSALLIGMACSVLGLLTLQAFCGTAAMLVSAATILIYVLIYTPMKTRSPLATLVGAVPGALPPLIGWSAGAVLAGSSGLAPLTQLGGWALFALMFFWQIPHFLAIAWMYKDDYAKGGHAVLPVFDPSGKATSWIIVIGAIVMIPVVLLPMLAMSDRLGCISGTIAGAVSLAFVAACTPMLREATRATARRAFLGSVLQLPVVLLALVGEAVVRMLI